MATTDEILADPIAALDLPDGAMPLSAIVLVEYDAVGPGMADDNDEP